MLSAPCSLLPVSRRDEGAQFQQSPSGDVVSLSNQDLGVTQSRKDDKVSRITIRDNLRINLRYPW